MPGPNAICPCIWKCTKLHPQNLKIHNWNKYSIAQTECCITFHMSSQGMAIWNHGFPTYMNKKVFSKGQTHLKSQKPELKESVSGNNHHRINWSLRSSVLLFLCQGYFLPSHAVAALPVSRPYSLSSIHVITSTREHNSQAGTAPLRQLSLGGQSPFSDTDLQNLHMLPFIVYLPFVNKFNTTPPLTVPCYK